MRSSSALLLIGAFSAAWSAAQADGNVQVQVDGSAINELAKLRDRNLAEYSREVNEIVAARLREVRVEQERSAADEAGHPVTLPTGACSAVVTIKGDGTIDRVEMAGCASPELANAEMTAIQQASPLPPLGTTVNLTVRTIAPIATPGIDGK